MTGKLYYAVDENITIESTGAERSLIPLVATVMTGIIFQVHER